MSDLQIRALAVLQEALAFEGEELERFLDRRCAGDPDLRHEIEALLDHDSTLGDDFLETPILARFSDTDPLRRPPPPTPEWLGSYRVVGELGRGGMGSVYIGEQDEPVKRRVALKVARLADDEKVRARFRSECRALARLNHPNIAALYEIGTADDDYPFVALELVDGEAITTYCDRHGLDVRERLELYLGVCAGVQHAHEKGILHRDIKPSNVMVTEVDGRPTAKVIDFGIAYGLDEPLGTVTQDRQLVGSLAYISPEAAQHGKGELDTRSDVFSLGLLLYELLVGVLPYRLEGLSLFSRFTNDDLPRASVRLASFDDEKRLRLAEQRSVTPAMHLDTLRGDLDAILDQALMADRDQRYDSPSSLGRDLQSHLDARPISARPPSAAYVASRFIRRHVPLVTLALLLVVSMVVGTVLSVREARRAAEAAAQAEQARIEAEEVSRFLIELFEIGDPERNRDEPADVATLLDLGAERLRTELIEQPVTRARLLHTLGELATKLARYDQAERLIAEALELREDALDATHPDLFESINQLGVIYRLTGRLD
ncbi:MAG: serine/threonine-protein kinase, partial [Acidobacteriota bacterium]